MSGNALKLNSLYNLSPEEITQELEQWLGGCASSDASIRYEHHQIAEKIRDYECRYKMTSDEMRSKLIDGDLVETNEICDWTILLEIQEQPISDCQPA
ncbi:MAG: hypothetical protein HC790_11095 [Acaryochloridaceae cyanobacterium CSU_3_4]|nr:hypothetical protein [Acaryochloris sp. SU_5_25]NJN39128.1 hypothetical protein [Acaryochloridaceae cyanobacterium CSU_3_4]